MLGSKEEFQTSNFELKKQRNKIMNERQMTYREYLDSLKNIGDKELQNKYENILKQETVKNFDKGVEPEGCNFLITNEYISRLRLKIKELEKRDKTIKMKEINI